MFYLIISTCLEQAKEAGLENGGGVTLEDGFSTFELRQTNSRRNTLSSKRGTLKSQANGTASRR